VEAVATPCSLNAEFGKRISSTILSVLKETKGAPIKAGSRPMTVVYPRNEPQLAFARMLKISTTAIQ
jgi:hypothetical protein